jgi:hypothetical protein
MQTEENIQKFYQAALESLIAKIKNDRNIIAAILWGSLSHDRVWEKSDIDLWLISRDGKTKYKGYCLVENGVNIHTEIVSRNEAKRIIERGLPWFVRSTLLFSKDESIQEWYQYADRYHIGARDKEVQLLTTANDLLQRLAQAEKQFYVNKDLNYSFLHIMRSVQGLARIEVILNNEMPDREVIQPALKYNPDFFNAVFTNLIHKRKNEEKIQRALDIINEYIEDKIFTIFKPLLDVLSEAGGVRTATEMSDYFDKRLQDGWILAACEWLAEKGIIEQVSSPLRLLKDSRIAVEEVAYYYDGGGL